MTTLAVAGVPPAPVKSPLLVLDTLDDRRELWHLLHKLSPHDRYRFLADCCTRLKVRDGVTRPSWHRMAPTVAAAYRDDESDRRLTNEVYGDILMLAANWKFDLLAAAVRLESLVRGRR